MLNAMALLEILLSWSLLFAIALWYTRITRDLHSGRLARIICMTALGVVILPVAKVILPSVEIAIAPYPIWQLLQWPVTEAGLMWVITIFAIGVFLRLFPIILSHLETHSALRDAEPAPELFQCSLNKVARAHELKKVPAILIADVAGPFTSGFIRPKIIFPERALHWQGSRIERVITHELAHIARKDWLWHSVLDVLFAFVWFMPGIQSLKQRFTWLSELNADDAVLNFDNNRTDYATDLLEIVQTAPKARALALTPSQTLLIDRSYCYERIAAVLDGSRHRSLTPLRPSTMLSILLAMILWASIGVVRIVPAPFPAFMLPKTATEHPQLIVSYLADSVREDAANFHGPSGDASEPTAMALPSLPTIEEVVVRAEPENISPEYLNQRLAEELAAERGRAFMVGDTLMLAPTVVFEGHMPIQLVTPDYPKAAARKKIEGRVTAQFDISATGTALNIRITQTSAGDTFNNAVIEALQKSRFKPAQHDGLPITTQHVEHIYTFKLTDHH